jgi:hypothetical protein
MLCVTLVLLAVAPTMPPPNQPPVANDDRVIVPFEPQYVDIWVLDNDYDPDGDPLTVVAVPAMEGGKAVIVQGQIVRVYLPAPPLAPGDGLPILPVAKGTYLVSDGRNMSMAHWQIILFPE